MCLIGLEGSLHSICSPSMCFFVGLLTVWAKMGLSVPESIPETSWVLGGQMALDATSDSFLKVGNLGGTVTQFEKYLVGQS